MQIVNGLPVINNLSAAQNYAVNIDSYETITQSLFDSAPYPTTGINQLTFYQLPVGSGVGVISGNAKTPEDTNMAAAGNMPAMQAYIITSLEIEVQPGVTTSFAAAALPSFFGTAAIMSGINDVYKIRSTGYLNLQIGSKSYMQEGPLMKFPASNDFEVGGAMANATTAAASQFSASVYGKAVGPSYVLTPNNLLLIPNQNFALTLNWATIEPVVSAARIFSRFMGQLMRAAQ